MNGYLLIIIFTIHIKMFSLLEDNVFEHHQFRVKNTIMVLKKIVINKRLVDKILNKMEFYNYNK